MAWVRSSDDIAFHPKVLAPLAEGDPELVDTLFGFFMRLASQSAGHLTDYFVSDGTVIAVAMGPERGERLVGLLDRYGYVTRTEGGWLLHDDPEFVHLRRREEVEWERQQSRDNNRPALNVPVRLRDGDACRFCRRVVNWSDRRGGRGGTYEHLIPGKPATLETQVVACKRCNSARKRLHNRDDIWPLLPAPTRPYYSESTVGYFARHGEVVRKSPESARPTPVNVTSRPGAVYDPEADQKTPPSDPATSGTPQGTAGSPARQSGDPATSGTTPTPTTAPEPARGEPETGDTAAEPENTDEPITAGNDAESVDLSETCPNHSPEPRFPGSGRDGTGRSREGSGRVGPERDGPGGPPAPAHPSRPGRKRKRAPRGKNRRGGPDA